MIPCSFVDEGPVAPRPVERERLAVSAVRAARRLLGAVLAARDRTTGEWCCGQIVEVEAYRQSDPASHAYGGKTARNASLFLAPGHAYVYRSYGLHWCINVACERPDIGAAVLIRALRPVAGLAAMRARRGPTARAPADLCRGPGNVCRALGIDQGHDGRDMLADDSPIQLWAAATVPAARVVRGPRIGITRAMEVPWRLWVADEKSVSGARRPPLKAPSRRA